jgi:hypothetical protein
MMRLNTAKDTAVAAHFKRHIDRLAGSQVHFVTSKVVRQRLT